MAPSSVSAKMPRDAGNINILHARSVRKTRTETTQQIAVPHPWISGKGQPPSDTYIQTDRDRQTYIHTDIQACRDIEA